MATASDYANGNTGLAALAIDGVVDDSSSWNSGSRDGLVKAPSAWFQLNLGTPQSICKVVLAWRFQGPASYSIQTSADGNAWTSQGDAIAGTGAGQHLNQPVARLDETVLATTVTAQFLNYSFTTTGSGYGYQLYETAVHGSV